MEPETESQTKRDRIAGYLGLILMAIYGLGFAVYAAEGQIMPLTFVDLILWGIFISTAHRTLWQEKTLSAGMWATWLFSMSLFALGFVSGWIGG